MSNNRYYNVIKNPGNLSCVVDGSTTLLDKNENGIWVRQGDGSACGDHNGQGINEELSISWEEAEQCRLLIEQAATDAGHGCS